VLTAKQRNIAAGMGAALAVTAVLLLWPGGGEPSQAFPAAMRALVSPAFAIAAGVAFVARARFFDPDAIDGIDGSKAIDLANRYLGNTVEQGVLAAATWLAFAATVPARAAFLLPILAIVFFVARLLFAVGYAVAPQARAFGFALTFYPTVGILLQTLRYMVA